MGGDYFSIFVYKVGLREISQLVSFGDPRQTVGGEIKGQTKFLNEIPCVFLSINALRNVKA